jgi:chloramphenicol 3-O-phosphotransferase
MVVSGARYPTPEGTSEEALAQLSLRLENSVAVAKIFSANGFDAIVDEIIHAERFAQLVSLLDGQEFYFVTLLRSLEEMKQRWHAMNSPYAEKWDWLDRDIREATPRVGLWLDTTGQTPDESVAEILQRLDEALVRQS